MKNRIATPLFLLQFMFAWSAIAGNGTYTDSSPDLIELHVSFMYNEPCFGTAGCADWEKLFKESSKLLYDATEKQVKFSKIYFYNNCPEAGNKADVKIYNDTQGASAHTPGLGKPGLRIRLSQTHKTVTTSGSGNRGQFGLIHEMGHYAFGLKDEYQDKNGNTVADAYCIDQNGTVASIMDGGTTVPNNNERHEFCWSGNHRTGHTEQDQKRTIGSTDYEDTDSWTWIQAFVKDRYSADLTLPTANPSADTSGYGDDPMFAYYDCGIRSVLCIDRSGSMSGAISLAKQGAKSFIDLLEDRDQAAAVSYSSSVSTDYSMNSMTAANKTAAKSAVDSISASDTTNIGGGLQTSLNEIVNKGNPLSNEIVVLLSDGMHNTGTHPDNVLPAIKNRGVTVHTIGLGNVDAALMSNIASETGGTYLYANDASQLSAHYTTMLADLRNNGMIESLNSEMEASQSKTFPVYIDSFTSAASVDFVLTWLDTSQEFAFSLYRPDGSLVKAEDSDITYRYSSDTGSKVYRVDAPESGSWSLMLENKAGYPIQYSLFVLSAPMDITFKAFSEQKAVMYPEPILVKAVVTTDNNIGGAEVTANVSTPDGDTAELILYDNGNDVNGDVTKDDGIYSAYFDAFTEDGSYTFDVTVDSKNGYTVAEEEDGGGFISEPVDRFVRKSKFSVVVTGVPDIISALVDIDPETLNTKSKGKFITAYIELNDDSLLHNIDQVSIVFKDTQTIASALDSPSEFGDHDSDGTTDLMVKFSRQEVLDYLNSVSKINTPVTFTVEGKLVTGEVFRGSSTVQVMTPGSKSKKK